LPGLILLNFDLAWPEFTREGDHMNSRDSFEKTPDCPTNEALLAYGRGARRGRSGVAAHLAGCEFCSLLLEMLRSHPGAGPPAPAPPPLPEALRRALLEQLRLSNSCQ
jgi:hypothetical protein